MLRIGFLVPDKPWDRRRLRERPALSWSTGSGQQNRAASTPVGSGAAGAALLCRTPALHTRAAGLGHRWSTQPELREADGVLRAVKWWMWLSGTFYARERSWGSAKQRRAGLAGGEREQQRRGLEHCQAQPPPPAGPGGPSPGPPSATAVLTWKQKIK